MHLIHLFFFFLSLSLPLAFRLLFLQIFERRTHCIQSHYIYIKKPIEEKNSSALIQQSLINFRSDNKLLLQQRKIQGYLSIYHLDVDNEHTVRNEISLLCKSISRFPLYYFDSKVLPFKLFFCVFTIKLDYCQEQPKSESNKRDTMEMKLLAAVADSAERAIENNVMVLDNSSSVKGTLLN